MESMADDGGGAGCILPAISSREICVYTKCYCEENVWHLCNSILQKNPNELTKCFAVFISNHEKCIPIWQQQAAKAAGMPVLWDYHVILIQREGNVGSMGSLVYDLDTSLQFPCPFFKYVELAFGSEKRLVDKYQRVFRVVPGDLFLEKFASDRSHMLTEDKTWMSLPPSYPCIKTRECDNNLADFMSMDPSIGFGEVLGLEELCNKFGPEELFPSLVSLLK